MFDCIIVVILRNIEIMVVPLYELGGWGWSGVLGSCDHGLLFMFTVISWGICLIGVLVWCVVVLRLLDVFCGQEGSVGLG